MNQSLPQAPLKVNMQRLRSALAQIPDFRVRELVAKAIECLTTRRGNHYMINQLLDAAVGSSERDQQYRHQIAYWLIKSDFDEVAEFFATGFATAVRWRQGAIFSEGDARDGSPVLGLREASLQVMMLHGEFTLSDIAHELRVRRVVRRDDMPFATAFMAIVFADRLKPVEGTDRYRLVTDASDEREITMRMLRQLAKYPDPSLLNEGPDSLRNQPEA